MPLCCGRGLDGRDLLKLVPHHRSRAAAAGQRRSNTGRRRRGAVPSWFPLGQRLSLPRLRGDVGVGERKTIQRTVMMIIQVAVWRKVLQSCALAGLQKCARGFACLVRTSSVVKSFCVIKSAPRHLDPRASVSVCVCLCVCVEQVNCGWRLPLPVLLSPPLASYRSGAM